MATAKLLTFFSAVFFFFFAWSQFCIISITLRKYLKLKKIFLFYGNEHDHHGNVSFINDCCLALLLRKQNTSKMFEYKNKKLGALAVLFNFIEHS